MAPQKLLTPLVALDFLLAVATIATEAVLQKFLPAAVRDAAVRGWLAPAETMLSSAALYLAWAVSVGLFVAAWIGLLMFWRRSREVYLLAWGLTLVVLALSGPSILTPVGAVLDGLGTLVSGALIGLVWFSDLAPRYAGASGTGDSRRPGPQR
jgi:uncharacterized membrane protein